MKSSDSGHVLASGLAHGPDQGSAIELASGQASGQASGAANKPPNGAAKTPTMRWRKVCGLLLAGLLGACGGGGGGGGGSTDAPTTEPPLLQTQCVAGSAASLAQQATPRQGRNTELMLLACAGTTLSQVRWTQNAGPTLASLSTGSQALSVAPDAPGPYRFDVSYLDATGQAHSTPVSFTAAAAADTLPVLLRGEPSALAGSKLSLRAWAPTLNATEQAQASLAWTQIDGPTATLGDTSTWRLVFTAPQVSTDSVIRLRFSATLADGRVATGQFSLLVQAPATRPADPLFTSASPASRVYPYRAQGPFAQALTDCVYSPNLSRSNPNNLCTLGRLPLLGQMTAGAVPTLEQVMQRVLVSNDWMGAAFENFLRDQDTYGDYRRMLASVTAIVMGGQVRPAFYWNATGAIYLDASYLWLTPEQRDTVSESPDPRSNYGAALNYAQPWRYVKDNQYAVTSYAIPSRLSRDAAELRYELGRLLYHELTHAGDFLPPRVHASLNSKLYVYQASPALTASQDLSQRLPFWQSILQGLARVRSFGDTPTAEQIAYMPAQITAMFSADRVNDSYSYSVPTGASFSREDAAMLVEEGLMQLRYGVMRDVAITNPLLATANSADLVLDWGQRGRIGEALIRPRLKMVLAEVMPWLDPNLPDQLIAPLALHAGGTWGANLNPQASAAGRAMALTAQQRFNEQEQTTRALRER